MSALLSVMLCAVFVPYGQTVHLQTRMDKHDLSVDSVQSNAEIIVSQLRETNALIRNNSKATVKTLYDIFSMIELKDQVRATELDLTKTSMITTNLINELRGVKTTLVETQEIISKHSTDITENTKAILELRNMLMKTRPTHAESDLSTTEVANMKPQPTTSEIEPTTTAGSTMTVQYATTDLDPTAVTAAACPDNWSVYQNTCFLYVHDWVTWNMAVDRCAEHGAILAEPDTREKLQYIWQITTDKDYYIWVGGTDRQAEGAWVWGGSGRPVVTPLWAPGQPNSQYGDEDCIMMGNVGWYDGACTWERPYMCEKRINA